MKALLVKYKSVIRFVLLFLGTYILLTVIYGVYLKYTGDNSKADGVTQLVAKQSTTILNELGYVAAIVPHESEPSMKLFVNGTYLAQIIEGCNSISICILFIAFIVAFAERFKKTVLYILAGVALIYSVNLLRIVMLTIALYRYPEYEQSLHGFVFPAVIYGMVFLLWMGWVRMLKPRADA